MKTVHYTAEEMAAKETAKARKWKIILIAGGAITLVALLGCITCLVMGSLAPPVEPTLTGTYVPQVITTEANTDNATATAAPVVVATATLAPTYTSQPTPIIPSATPTPTITPSATPAPTVTDTPMPPPTRMPQAAPPTAVPTSPPPVCDCSYNRYNCADFATHWQAQACYNYCRSIGAGDVHRLDADNDGRACEGLP